MKLANLLSTEQILLEMKSGRHWEAIVELIDLLEATARLGGAGVREDLLQALRERETLVSTGIGSGVAIPHVLSDRIHEVTAAFGRSRKGIDFEALDRAPVHFVVLFLVPREEYGLHLQTLAAIAKTFARREVRSRLAAAQTREEIIEILDGKPAAAAAEEVGTSA